MKLCSWDGLHAPALTVFQAHAEVILSKCGCAVHHARTGVAGHVAVRDNTEGAAGLQVGEVPKQRRVRGTNKLLAAQLAVDLGSRE